jgi:putative membrane protein insertion efficiency factor
LLFKGLILTYRWGISPVLGSHCRHYPSCSTYALWALEKGPLIPGLFRTTIRILRCNPFFEGGFDYPRAPRPAATHVLRPIKVKWWYIPTQKGECLLIKSLKE